LFGIFSVFRFAASLILGLVIFFGLAGYLLISNFRDNFLNTEFYTDNLAENDVYERFYDEVLLDPEFEDTTDNLLGDIDVSQEDIVGIVREIITADYLQSQVEGAVKGSIDYLKRETDTPEVFIDLGPPLERVKPEVFKYIDRRIDGLEDVPVTTIEELQEELQSLYRTLEMGKIPTQVPSIEDPKALVSRYVDQSIAKLEVVPARTTEDFQEGLENLYRELASGQIPTRIPSIEAIPVSVRTATYDLVFQVIRTDPSIPKEAIKGLEEQEEAIKAQLVKGDVKGALETASRPLTGPVVERYVDDAYDRAFQTLKDDQTFPQKALEGLDKQSDTIKEYLGAGKIKEALKVGARGLTGPLIDETLEEVKTELDEQDRLDLVAVAAEQNGQTKEEFLDDLEPLRDIIGRTEGGRWLALLMLVGGAVLMAFIHLPRLSSALRWPGLTLFLSGLVFLVLGLVLKAQLPDRLDDLLSQGVSGVSPIPPTMIDLISDVLTAMSSEVAGGFIAPSTTVLAIGLAMFVGSYFIRLLHIPFLSR